MAALISKQEIVEELLAEEQPGVAPIESRLRRNILKVPQEISRGSGIVIFGRRVRSLVFTTDLAVILNCDADAVFAVYPFTPQRSISAAIINAAPMPVFVGVGGGITTGSRTVYLANDAESQGAMAVVLNAPISNRNLRAVSAVVDIPVVVTIASAKTDAAARIKSGASILNVAAGKDTPDVVAKVRASLPNVPIMATGGKTVETIEATIDAGANAIIYTPPTPAELLGAVMANYRDD